MHIVHVCVRMCACVCVCVCLCVLDCVRLCVLVCVRLCVYTCMCMCVCVHLCLCVLVFICIVTKLSRIRGLCFYVCVSVYICVNAFTHVCMYICVYVRACVNFCNKTNPDQMYCVYPLNLFSHWLELFSPQQSRQNCVFYSTQHLLSGGLFRIDYLVILFTLKGLFSYINYLKEVAQKWLLIILFIFIGVIQLYNSRLKE